MPKHPKRPFRIETSERCTIVREDGKHLDGNLINLSDEGFCVESSDVLDSGERIEMHVTGLGRMSGIVRWRDGMRAGGVLEPYSRGGFDP